MVWAWSQRTAFPGAWGVLAFGFVAFLLEVTHTQLRGGGGFGGLGFMVYLAAFVLFGGFWAAAIAMVAVFAGQMRFGRPANKAIFNSAQTGLSVLVAATLYAALGGASPPLVFQGGVATTFDGALRDLGAYFAAVVAYIVTNSVAVSGAVAISSGRSFRHVWRTNTLWVLGYDLGASVLALMIAGAYVVFDRPDGLTRFGFLAIFVPIIAAKHIYGKLNSLQILYDELDRAHERLELNVREQLAMMVKSIEARDPYTSGHSRRVSAISRAIAIDYGLSDELVDEVENAALLHDVGKIHAEFAPLLQKEGKLTPEEWEIIKTHSAKSAELVGLFSRFQGHVQESVRHHHERWDGMGYPEGIAGDRIPLGARIIMIADTIDAMTTDRPYRKALGFDVVVAELQKHKGTQFDPKLVDTTISSVSVRRLASKQDVDSAELSRKASRATPLRSYGNLFVGRRVGVQEP
jgi:HD-GYP domain-containing protein (c-di-GMP phosphodiesterase class II)